MNPFQAFPGIRINGIFHSRESLVTSRQNERLSDFERLVCGFAAQVFDDKESLSVQTSGSTGPPKTQTFKKSAFLESARATNRYFNLNEASRAALVLPMRYIAGKMMVVRAIAGQFDLLASEPTGNPMDVLDTRELSFIAVTPFQAHNMLEHDAEKLSSTGAVLLGGGAISHALRAALRKHHISAFASFGMTETLSHFALANLGAKNDTLIYEPLENVEIRTDSEGALQVNWPPITDGWVDTNDLVNLSKGGFEWLGRRDYLINSGGVKVIPEAVEERLTGLFKLPFFVAGVPHATLGEITVVFVESAEVEASVQLAQIHTALSDKPYWQPKKIVALKAFMRTESGKIRRKATLESWLAKPS